MGGSVLRMSSESAWTMDANETDPGTAGICKSYPFNILRAGPDMQPSGSIA